MFCFVYHGNDSPQPDSFECMCAVGRVVVLDMRFYVSRALYAGVGTDRVEFVPDEALFFDLRGSGFKRYPNDIFLAELRGIDGFPVFTDFRSSQVEVGFVEV